MQAVKGMLRLGKKAPAATADAPAAPELPPAPPAELQFPEVHTKKVVVEPPAGFYERGGTPEAWHLFETRPFFKANKESQHYIKLKVKHEVRRAAPGAVDATLARLGDELQRVFETGTETMMLLTCLGADAAVREAQDLKDDVSAFLLGKQAADTETAAEYQRQVLDAMKGHRGVVAHKLSDFSMSRMLRDMAGDAQFAPILAELLEDEDTSYAAGVPTAISELDSLTFTVNELYGMGIPERRSLTFAGAAACTYYLGDINALGGNHFYYIFNTAPDSELSRTFRLQRELLTETALRLLQMRAIKRAMDDDLHGSTKKLLGGMLDMMPFLLNGEAGKCLQVSTSLLVELQRVTANYNAAAVLAVDKKADAAASRANRAAEVAKATASVTKMTASRVDKQALRLALLEREVRALTGSKRKQAHGYSGSDSEGEERAAKRHTPTLPRRYQGTVEAMEVAASPAPRSALRDRNGLSINSHPLSTLSTLAAAKVAAAAAQPTPAVAAAAAAGRRVVPEPAVGRMEQAAAGVAAQESESDEGYYVMEV